MNKNGQDSENELLETLYLLIRKLVQERDFGAKLSHNTALHFTNALRVSLQVYDSIRESYQRLGLPEELVDKKAFEELSRRIFNPDISESIFEAVQGIVRKPAPRDTAMYG